MQTDDKIKEFCEREYASLTNNQKLPTDLKNSPSRKLSGNTNTNGRWTREEHIRFVEGLSYFGKNWKLVEEYVGTRSGAQIRSHAQKFFNRLEREYNKQNQQKKINQQAQQPQNLLQNPNEANKNGQKLSQFSGLNTVANQFQKQYRKRFESFDSTTSHDPYSEDITQHFEEKVSPEALQQLVHQDNAQKKDIKEWISYYTDQQNKLLSLQADPLTMSKQNDENISKINGIIQLLSAYDNIQENAQQQFQKQQLQTMEMMQQTQDSNDNNRNQQDNQSNVIDTNMAQNFPQQRYWNTLGQKNSLSQNEFPNMNSSQQLSQPGLDFNTDTNNYNIETQASQFKNNEIQKENKKRKGSFALKETGDDQQMEQKKERLENFRKILKSNQETEIPQTINNENNKKDSSQYVISNVKYQDQLETQSNPEQQNQTNTIQIINNQKQDDGKNEQEQQQQQQQINDSNGYFIMYDFVVGHTKAKAPDPIRTPKLSVLRRGQYQGGGPLGKSTCQSTGSHQNSEVKRLKAWLVLRWGTAWEVH
ncbi:Homeodomain protein [Pseudocohnilembus persalinus]|uniref:Homeodomain protein n=1 Tax=Pseudocohnilembus persalinus TaxID=266149 RepID=A0A0V0QU48_PSEPJ|nr:Homeodomain protein [Pseudocohnilembus persalinus]|eukprot:KRX05677.1 Homeodomain protein [Pseudocohnilembus persalinus]